MITDMSISQKIINLWPDKAHVNDSSYLMDADDDVERLTNVNKPLLKVFEPRKEKKKEVGIIVCPGGAYQFLSVNLEGSEIASWLNGLGITAFVLQYSVPDNRDDALKDLVRAQQVVLSNFAGLKKLGVLGFSAGAHLAFRVIVQNDKKFDFGILMYPAYFNELHRERLSPELQFSEKLLPLFIAGANDDMEYAESTLVLSAALKDIDSPFELHFFAQGGHGFGLRPENKAGRIWPGLAENWMKNIAVI